MANTPGRLALISALTLIGAASFAVVGSIAERSRAGAAAAVRSHTEPLLVQAVELDAALSDADATVTATFQKGGLEPSTQRMHYFADLRSATGSLASLTRETGDSVTARAAVTTITSQLPVYGGLVETARADNRQGFPIGAAYLRQASALLDGRILPAARRLYASEAHLLDASYVRGTAGAVVVALAGTSLAALALLVLAQRYLARISRRVFNLPLVAATIVLLGVAAWTLAGVIGEQNALTRARRASDAVEVLSGSRILLSRAQSDESLTLVNRGSDEVDPVDFALVRRALAPPAGLIGEARALAARAGHPAAGGRLTREFASYVAAPASGAAGRQLAADLQGQTAAAQARFAAAAVDATSWTGGLPAGIPLLTAVACALALLGIRQRLEEYR